MFCDERVMTAPRVYQFHPRVKYFLDTKKNIQSNCIYYCCCLKIAQKNVDGMWCGRLIGGDGIEGNVGQCLFSYRVSVIDGGE